jgi:radical SAM protein with 4Fe4S-binding SPASM domain
MTLKDLTLEITKKCPMGCILCSSDGGEPLSNEFKLSELKEIVIQAKSIGVSEISLSGGEPLTYPYILDICEYITSLGINASLYTSGNIFGNNNSLLPVSVNYFLKLRDAGVKKVVFSIHGSNPQIHDKITGRRESFKNLIESIRNARKADLYIEAHFVPLRENFRELPNIVSLLRKVGLKSFHVLRFVPQGRGELHKDVLGLRPKEVLELRKILEDIINKSELRIVVGAHYNCLGLNNNTQCTAGIEKAVIRPDGFVFPCVGMKRIKSFIDRNNIRDMRLEDIIDESYGFTLLKTILIESKNNSCHSCISEYNCTNGCIAQRIIAYGNRDLRNDPHCINKFDMGSKFFSKNKVIDNKIYSERENIDVRCY